MSTTRLCDISDDDALRTMIAARFADGKLFGGGHANCEPTCERILREPGSLRSERVRIIVAEIMRLRGRGAAYERIVDELELEDRKYNNWMRGQP